MIVNKLKMVIVAKLEEQLAEFVDCRITLKRVTELLEQTEQNRDNIIKGNEQYRQKISQLESEITILRRQKKGGKLR